MSRSLAAGVLLTGFEGTSVPPWLWAACAEGLAGVLLFAPNTPDLATTRALTDELRPDRPAGLPGLVVAVDGRFMLPGHSSIPFADEPALQPIIHDIENVQIPENIQVGIDKARSLAKTAMLQRSQDFAASARSYLLACRLQWDAVEAGEPGATLEDLRWYMASYASVRAGELSQIHRDYAHSRPYYLAFFFLVQEDDPLWSRMRGLINPMLSYYWVNAWRELGLNAGNPSLSATTPAEIAVRAATHETQELCSLWYAMSNALAEVNPGLLRRVASQIRLNRGESPIYAQVADSLEQMLMQ